MSENKDIKKTENKELNNEELDKVSGGNWFSKLWEKIKLETQEIVNNTTENEDFK